MDLESWAPIPGYEGSYEASDLGRVRSLDRVTDRGRKWRGRTMTPTPMRNGYLVVTLWRSGRQRTALVHRLILAAFRGEHVPRFEGLHNDGDQNNNALANLRWGTHSENELDKIAHGTHRNGSKDRCSAGHFYTPENTYIYPGKPHRGCRECRRAYQIQYASRKRK